MNKSQYQKYIVETVHRSDIKNAEYNPRIIDDSAKKKLREALKEHGLIEPIIWNKLTGNLVGGHQRLEQLDALEGTYDYSLDVSVIAVDEREEAILNVQLNNPSMQGDWDIDKLAGMKLDFDIGFDEMGFDQLDVDFLFAGDDRFSELYDTPEVEASKEQIEMVREARGASREILAEENSANFYSMLIFRDEKEKKAFYKAINTPVYEEVLTLELIKRYAKNPVDLDIKEYEIDEETGEVIDIEEN